MIDAFCWIDIETTGLDPVKDLVLEIGVKVTDFQFHELNTFHFWVNDASMLQTQRLLDSFIERMHTESGLLDDSFHVPKDQFYASKPLPQLDIDFSAQLDFIKSTHDINNLFPAGSSVHFDMAFLRGLGLTMTLARLHHRHFDVTTLKLCSQVQTGFYPETKNVEPQHRALSDIESSILAAKQLTQVVAETSLQADHTMKVIEAQQNDPLDN